MLSQDFQKLLVCFFFLVLIGMVSYGFYCNRKSRSFTGTGRVADIEAWNAKAILTWIATFGLSVLAIVNYI
jgi:hypothetical protein